mgnify:CR=1 FL=1
MSSVVSLYDLNFKVWNEVVRLYHNDPIHHAYLIYDLIYELDKTNVYFVLSNNRVASYILIWAGTQRLGIHLWGNDGSLVNKIPLMKDSIIQLYNINVFDAILGFLEDKGRIEVGYFMDMLVDEEEFKPYRPEKAVRLKAKESSHVKALMKLKEVQGRPLSEGLARERLNRWYYYGVFKENALVSIACAYLRLPEVWIIGDVFTHPEYRSRGYAKVVTSAVTRDAIVSGAKVLLHVKEGNIPAIKVYKALGYKVIGRRPWIFYKPE